MAEGTELVFDDERFQNVRRIPVPSRTMLAAILSENRTPSPSWDHVHSSEWTDWTLMLNDVEVDRHRTGKRRPDRSGGSANYLYADGHVESITSDEMRALVASGVNPAAVPEETLDGIGS